MERNRGRTMPVEMSRRRHFGQANIEFIGVLAGMLLIILYGGWVWRYWRARLTFMEATYSAMILNQTRHTATLMTKTGGFTGIDRAREIALTYPLLEEYGYVPSYLVVGATQDIAEGSAQIIERGSGIPLYKPVFYFETRLLSTAVLGAYDELGYEGVPQWVISITGFLENHGLGADR